MWSQLLKNPVGASQQPERSDFNVQHGETPPSCQEGALRPAHVGEAVDVIWGRGVGGW